MLMIALGLGSRADAQTISPAQNSLTNQDVIVLAKAGFNEDFLIDLIGTSRSHFDTSSQGLAGLAKQGLTEHLIRTMLTAAQKPAQPAPLPITEGTPGTFAAVLVAAPEPSGRDHAPKAKDSTLAMERHASYAHSTSVLWGAWKNKTEVGASPASAQDPDMFLGAAYGQVKLTKSAGASAHHE